MSIVFVAALSPAIAGTPGSLVPAGPPAAPAAAQVSPQTPPGLFGHPSWGFLYVGVDTVSDYRFDGMSNSDNKPSVQATLFYGRPDGLYTGAELSKVYFGDVGHTSLETDYFGGKRFHFGPTELNVEQLYAVFPDQAKATGPSYGFLETTGEVARTARTGPLKGLKVLAGLSWSPNYAYDTGAAWKVKGAVDYPIRPWLKIGAELGRYWVERGLDHLYWTAGATATWRRLSFDLRYVGTDLSREQCFYTERCKPAVVAGVTLRLWP